MMNIDFTTLTEEELKTLYRNVVDEHARRDNMKRAKLIENFRNAWHDLNSMGIDVYYDADGEEIYLTHWDDFNFS
jgi:hypothetical protein